MLIDDNAHDSVVGGSRRSAIPQNTFSGNLGYQVIRNYIGLDRLGRLLPNVGRPIVNRGRHNTIRGNRDRPGR